MGVKCPVFGDSLFHWIPAFAGMTNEITGDGPRTRKACSLYYRGRGSDSPLCLPVSPPGQKRPVPFGGRVFLRDRGQVAQCTEPLILSIDVNCRVQNSLTNPNPYMTMTSPLAAQDGLRTRKACSFYYRGRGSGSPLCLPVSPPGQKQPVPLGGRVFYAH